MSNIRINLVYDKNIFISIWENFKIIPSKGDIISMTHFLQNQEMNLKAKNEIKFCGCENINEIYEEISNITLIVDDIFYKKDHEGIYIHISLIEKEYND